MKKKGTFDGRKSALISMHVSRGKGAVVNSNWTLSTLLCVTSDQQKLKSMWKESSYMFIALASISYILVAFVKLPKDTGTCD